jgi:hypothetical protein
VDVEKVGSAVKGRREVHMLLDEAGTDQAHADARASDRDTFVADQLQEPRLIHP